MLAELNKTVEQVVAQQMVPILITSPMLRPHLQRIIEPFVSQLVVLSHNEVGATVRIRNLGVVKV